MTEGQVDLFFFVKMAMPALSHNEKHCNCNPELWVCFSQDSCPDFT